MLNKFILKIASLFFKVGFTLYDSLDDFDSVQKEREKSRGSKMWYCKWVLRIVMPIIVVVLGLLLFNGCSAKNTQPSVVYEPVMIPQKCEVDIPQKPLSTGDIAKDNVLILQYSENLLLALKTCIK